MQQMATRTQSQKRAPSGRLAPETAQPAPSDATEVLDVTEDHESTVQAAVRPSSVGIRVAIVDDHPMVRDGLTQVLETQADISVVLSVGSGQELLDSIKALEFDICLLDASMSVLDGLETLRRFRALGHRAPVLMCSIFSESMFAPQCMREGANGFISKSSSSQQLIEAVRSVHRGSVYLSTDVLKSMMEHSTSPMLAHERLSSREFEIFLRIAQGRTNSEITRELHLDTRTVSTYRRRVLDKLGLTRDRDIVNYAIRHGLVE